MIAKEAKYMMYLNEHLCAIEEAQQKMKDQIEQLDERVIALENQALNTEPNSGPMQLDIVNPGVHDLELRIDQVSELQEIANKLQGKYDFLVLGVKKSLEDHPNIEVKDAKMLIKECLKRKAHVVSELMPCINILNKLNDFESFFDFLSKYDFIGYLNYMLLKKLSELVEDDDGINRLFLEYEKEYAKLLSAASFEDLIPFFEKQSDLSPTAPLGLPYVSFHLEKPWLVTSIYTWFSTLGEFSWSYYAFLKQLQKKCIIITYAILPCVLDDVMRDLKDPLILKKLEDKGITVIELPQKEEDIEGKEEDNAIEQLLREAKDIEFTTAAEKSVPDYDAAPNEEVNKLIEAIQDNSIANVTSLLKNGADPNVSEFPDGGPSALFVATKEDNIDIVELLLENGADPNLGCNTFHGTALHYASETNNADMVNLLLTKGKADVNAVDKWNRSPLFNAVDSGSIKAVRSLLKAEAKTDVVNEGGETLLHCAGTCTSDKVKMLRLLIKKRVVDINALDKRNRTPLFNAVESGSVEAVKILIENGAKTDVVDEDGQTLLHCAGELQMLKYLIYWGVDVDASDKDSRTPLFNAVESGNIEAVKFLIDIGASIGVVDKDGQTLLHCAGELEMLKYLIFRGVNVNALDKDNRTPLFNAVESGSVEAVEFLIDYGAAKIDVVDKYDNSSLLHCASETGNADIIKLLITKGKADVNAVDKYNRTPLFNAVESGSIEAIDILLTNGASTDVEDKLGNTLLKFAAEAGRTHVVELLYPEGHAKMAAASEKFGIDPSGLVIGKEEKKITKKQKDSVTKGMLQKSSDLALSPESVKSSLRIPRFRKPPKESSVGSGQSKLVKT